MSSEPRWATFDCYGTLVDWNGGVSRELARLVPDAPVGRLLARYHELEPELEAEAYRSYREVMALALERIAAGEGVELPADEREALADSLPGWPVFPEARGALERTRADGWSLCILSNTDRDLIESSKKAIGIPFDLTIVAEDVGSYKPAHGHWQRFYADTGARADHHVHVGASLFHDMAAAAELGLASVWVNRLGESRGGVVLTREIPDLSTLPEVLEELVPA
jgi:2-haloacid dehalogenase